jgi:hypothetical protein
MGGLAIAVPQLNWVLSEPPSNLAGLILGGSLVAGALLIRRLRNAQQIA